MNNGFKTNITVKDIPPMLQSAFEYFRTMFFDYPAWRERMARANSLSTPPAATTTPILESTPQPIEGLPEWLQQPTYYQISPKDSGLNDVSLKTGVSLQDLVTLNKSKTLGPTGSYMLTQPETKASDFMNTRFMQKNAAQGVDFYHQLRYDPERRKYVQIGKLIAEGKLDLQGGWHPRGKKIGKHLRRTRDGVLHID